MRLIEAMLRSAGLRGVAAGNLGTPALSLVGVPLDVAVLEVSSFQLESIDTFRPTVAVVLTLFVMVMLTGAMHEDGLADTVDAFGGGYDSERILAIMKDSRTGAFGVIALILVFALKIAVLVEMLHIEIIDTVLALMFTDA